MKIFRIIATLVTVAMAGQAADAPEKVTVYLTDISTVPMTVLYPSKVAAAHIFAEADVQIEWRTGVPATRLSPFDPVLLIDFSAETPENLMPAALAYAMPYEGVHIMVFYDRIARLAKSDRTNVMTYVLVHEVTHMLQGFGRHSETGVMKPRWNANDFFQMTKRKFSLTARDISLIRAGLANRDAARRLMASSSAAR